MALVTNPSHFINKTLQNIPFIHHMDKSQLQLGDSSFTFRTYRLKDFRIHSSASLQIFKHRRCQHLEEPPIPQLLRREVGLPEPKDNHKGAHSCAVTTAQAGLHLLRRNTSISSLGVDTNSQPQHTTVILLRTATPHAARSASRKVSASPGSTLSTSGD